MCRILNRLYYNYYNLDKKYYFPIDKDYIRMIYMLRNEDVDSLSIHEALKKYRNRNTIFNEVLNNKKEFDYLVENETIHITYPYEETIERLSILHSILGEIKWNEMFGFSLENLCDLLVLIIYRIFNYNFCHYEKQFLNEYICVFPNSKHCYFTKKEIYSFFNNNKEIDKIIDFISIDINQQKEESDSFRLIHHEGKYYLFFIWDFLYNLFDVFESYILDRIDNKDEYYKEKGKYFEELCYKKIKNNYTNNKIYKNLKYIFKKGNHEIDLVLELPNSYIFFECKSAEFNISKFDSNKEMYERFLTAFGRGVKTINNLNDYINSGNNLFFNNAGEKIILDLKNKKSYYINLSLYNIEYLQTQIQKIKSKYIRPVDIYPICWNYLDFGSIIKLTPLDTNLFEEYLDKRTKLINKKKNMTFDIDEFDVFGFLTDSRYNDVINMLMNSMPNNIDENFMISNGVYRRDFNNMFNEKFVTEYINSKTKK